jgi:two-component system, OmpR family, response regulator
MTDPGRLVLIVDDEPDMCWALEHLLNKQGFATCKGLSAQAGLNLMAQHRFAFAFLDAKLPDMEGLELARCIKEIDHRICIIMVSGYYYSDDDSIQEAISRGLIESFINKPFLLEDILKALDQCAILLR